MKNMSEKQNLPFQADWHCHVLPKMDDGAKHAAESLAMLRLLYAEGIRTVAATPHYYAHRESPREFAKRRQAALEVLLQEVEAQRVQIPKIMLGAEVHIERNISALELSPLANEAGILLLELPFQKLKPWMLREIENVAYGTEFTPMLAHVERYLPYYSKADYAALWALEQVVFQVNTSFTEHFRTRHMFKSLVKKDLPLVLGSDAHNMQSRPPTVRKAEQYARAIGAAEAKIYR